MTRRVFRLRRDETLCWAGLSVKEAHRRAKSHWPGVLEVDDGTGWRACRVDRVAHGEDIPHGDAGRATAFGDAMYVLRILDADSVDLTDWWPTGPTMSTRETAVDFERLDRQGVLADLVEVDVEAAELAAALVARRDDLDANRPGWRERTAAMRGN